MFPLEVFKEQKSKDKLKEVLKYELCNICLGRQWGMLGHGMTNEERGKILREFAQEPKEPETCMLCGNFFKEQLDKLAMSVVKRLKDVEFETFLVGSIVPDDIEQKQEELWMKTGIEHVEPVKAEINRELGKKIEKITGKKFNLNPNITVIVDLKKNEIRLQIRSLYVGGGYKKLVRSIPQSKWTCLKCGGKGCVECKGMGKLYPTSVQEIVDKPLLKATESKKSKFSAAGREDIDARCLDWRPFVIELIKPLKRKIDLKKIQKQINKSKKAQVNGLKLVIGRDVIRNLKATRVDKTYLAEAKFSKKIDKKKLKELHRLAHAYIMQKTPIRVVHRRADKFRKRAVKAISWKVIDEKTLQLKIRGESGLYIKELINGDEGRTKPNVSEMLGNKVKKISLDVIKIHK